MRHSPRLRSDEKNIAKGNFSDSIVSGLPGQIARSSKITRNGQFGTASLSVGRPRCPGENEGKAMRVRLATDGDLAAGRNLLIERRRRLMHHAGWYGVLRDACWVTPYFLMAVNDRARSREYCLHISAAAP